MRKHTTAPAKGRTASALKLLQDATARGVSFRELNLSHYLAGGEGDLQLITTNIPGLSFDHEGATLECGQGLVLRDKETRSLVWLILPLEQA